MLSGMRIDAVTSLLARLGVPVTRAPGDGSGDAVHVSDVAYDSRRVAPGSLFFCVRGGRDDGHRHAPAAVAAGAVALVCEEALPLPVPQLIVPDTRAAMNTLAAPFFGDPSRELAVVGVTGTNGKTTTAYLLDAVFRAGGRPSGLIGTVETRVGDEVTPGVRTTPEAVDLQRLLRRMADRGVGACAVEVTSIGLVQGRVAGTWFAAASFTNLTQDHLDFHGSMESYYGAKRALFRPGTVAAAVVNADDPWGRRLVSEVRAAGGLPVTTISAAGRPGADVGAAGVSAGAAGSAFRVEGTVRTAARDRPVSLGIRIRLPGAFNVANALGATVAAAAAGVPDDDIVRGLAGLTGVPGRFEVVPGAPGFTVVVDYAHTPDGVARVLDAARGLAAGGRVLAVFGCGGDRDRAKRPLMGRAAAERADVAYVTSDNPRSEEPEAIIAEILPGMDPPPPGGLHVVPDRREAIHRAVADARPGDVVVLAGKGHETGQEARGVVAPFDDRLVAAEALAALTPARAERP